MKQLERISYLIIALFITLGILLLFTHGKDSGPPPVKKIKLKNEAKKKGKTEKQKTYQVAFYNVENLFDTIQDPSTKDTDFLPGTNKKWNSTRYTKKVNDLAKVIYEINTKKPPVIVGLCEVENRNVIEDIIRTEHLRAFGYEIIHKNSPDERGIDVACIYRKSVFTPLSHTFYNVTLPRAERSATRDILYVKGVIAKDTLHLFFNHWPSRSGGQEKSEPNRIYAAQQLRIRIDSLLAIHPQTKIVVTGDFNDYPTDKSLYQILGAKETAKAKTSELINLTYELHQDRKGTYFYKGEWGVLDNVIVSTGLFHSTHKLKSDEAFIFSKEWMMYTNKKGEQSPNRTYGGDQYYGGVSDHLPVVLKLKYK